MARWHNGPLPSNGHVTPQPLSTSSRLFLHRAHPSHIALPKEQGKHCLLVKGLGCADNHLRWACHGAWQLCYVPTIVRVISDRATICASADGCQGAIMWQFAVFRVC
ncbi:hypothetical protein O6H91_23G027300 [Diphasiastrum complanatum]|uniref:Uncharacterized protein n=1 Tax=Diphasiastrum complanatum TaxID=34168 RepID=A0ACC2A959_DIPCM|nr:hypothetical protein O6H91_23G027300 [Diphasiastrum complanatum]